MGGPDIGNSKVTLDCRTKIICDAAADWAEPLREKWLKIESDLYTDQAIADATSHAQSAYEAHKRCDRSRNAIQFEQSRQAFFEAAEQYFRLRVHIGRTMVRNRIFEIDHHRERWDALFDTLQACKSYSEIEHWLDENETLRAQISHAVRMEEDSVEQIKARISKAINAMRSKDYEDNFGANKIYVELGKEAALRHFDDLQPKSIGRKSKDSPSPDVGRAYEFSNIIVAVAERLSANQLDEASDSEICEVLFKTGFNPALYTRAEVIRWLLNVHLNAEGISVRGFLNSISRGRAEFRNFVDWLAGVDPSRGD